MMSTVLYRFYWKERPVQIDDVVAQALEILTFLRNELKLINWYRLADSKEKALSKPITLTEESVKRLISRSTMKDLNNGYNELGFHISVYSVGQDGGDIGLSLRIGSSSSFIPNLVVLQTETGAEVSLSEAVKLSGSLIQLTAPDWGCVQTAEIASMVENTQGKVGWVTYTKKKKLRLDPAKFNSESICDGLLITVKDLNPSYVAGLMKYNL